MIQMAHFQVYAGGFVLLQTHMNVYITVYTPDTIPIICNLYCFYLRLM